MLCNTFTHDVLVFVPRRSRCNTLTCMLSGKGELKNDLKYCWNLWVHVGANPGRVGVFVSCSPEGVLILVGL